MEHGFLELCMSCLLSIRTHVLFAVIACLLLLHLRTRRKTFRNLPPGPWGLPFLGYLPFLSTDGPYLQLDKLRKKYGDIFGLSLGGKYAVFIGNIDKTREAYKLDAFSGRPDGAFPISKDLIHFGSANGQDWRERRKCSIRGLRQVGIGTEMIQDTCREELKEVVSTFERLIGSSSGKDVNVRAVLMFSTCNIALKFVCGKSFPSDHKSYKTVESFLRFFAEKASSLALHILLPWVEPVLNLMPSTGSTRMNVKDLENVIRTEVDNHLQLRPEIPKDLIDFYIKYYESHNIHDLPIDNICADALAMIFGGADSIRATAEWYLLCMASFPDIQERVFQEINDVLTVTGEVRYNERHLLPYAEASVLECMRYKIVIPVNPTHSALEDTVFCGYDIPKDSLVFSLLWTINNDPAYWSHPHKFHPEHFLTPDKSRVRIPESFVPFSLGKRSCPGDKMALMECYVICITLIQHFQILPPDGGINMEGRLRLTIEPRYPIVKLVKRQTF